MYTADSVIKMRWFSLAIIILSNDFPVRYVNLPKGIYLDT